MNTPNTCPKCRSDDIVRVPSTALEGCIPVSKLNLKPVHVTRFLCVACGFMEEWVEAPADLAKVKAYYRPD